MRSAIFSLLMTAALTAANPATAETFDGKGPLLCTAFRIFECDLASGCVSTTAQEIGASNAWTIDFKKKAITGTAENALPNAIDHVELLDGKLFLSGVQDGLAMERDGVSWTVSINNPDGVMTLMVAGEAFGVVGMGSCVPN